MRAAAQECNDQLRVRALATWRIAYEREMFEQAPAGQLRAILTLDVRLSDMDSGGWAKRWDAAQQVANAALAATMQALAPANLIMRMKAAGTPLALDDTGEHITVPARSQLLPSVVAEAVQHKAALLVLLRAEAEAVAEARRPVVIA